MAIPTIAISAEEFEKIASKQEGHFLDFKGIAITPAKLTRTLSAFANSDGGELFLGISDLGYFRR
jgi:ATP-dependent DNA helicase RecG